MEHHNSLLQSPLPTQPEVAALPAIPQRRGLVREALEKAFGLDLRALAVFRIGMGLMIIVDLLVRARDLRIHYTDAGVLPRATVINQLLGLEAISLHLFSGTTFAQVLLFAISALFAFSLLIGHRTRLSAVMSWALLVSLQNRNPLVLNGGDIIFRLFLFWSLFLPLGARYSIDAALSRDKTSDPLVFSFGSLALVLQIAIIYFFAALLKTGPEWHGEASAIHYALYVDQLVRPFGIWLRQFSSVLPVMTRSVWFFELLAPIALFAPFATSRTIITALLIAMHVGFALTLGLGVFPWICIAGLITLFPSSTWDRLARSLNRRQRPRPTLFYDGACGFCLKMVCIIQQLLFLDDLTVLPAQENAFAERAMLKERSWIVIDPTGRLHSAWDAFTILVDSSPVFWPLAQLLRWYPLNRIGRYAYRLMSQQRALWGKLTKHSLRFRKAAAAPTITHWIAAPFLAIVVFWNFAMLPDTTLTIPRPLVAVANFLRLDQRWDMFAPGPRKDDGWYVMPGRLENGKWVDVMNFKETDVNWNKSELLSDTFSSERDQKHLMNLWLADNMTYRLPYAQYLCRTWNAQRVSPHRLSTFSIFYMREDTTPNGKAAPERVTLWEHDCFAAKTPG